MRILKSDDYFDTDIKLKILDKVPQSDLEVHCHEFSELIFFVEGSGSHLINGYQRVILPNSLAFIDPKSYHQYVNSHHVHLFNLIYNKYSLGLKQSHIEILERLESSQQHYHFEQENFSELVYLLEWMKKELSHGQVHRLDIVVSIFEQITLLIDRYSLNDEKISPIMDAIRYISENYKDNELNINYVCGKFGITSKSLSNKISQLTGLSTNKFLNQLRVRKAISLLEQGQTITDVAYLVGYNDSNYFSTKFKGITGKSPKTYLVRR